MTRSMAQRLRESAHAVAEHALRGAAVRPRARRAMIDLGSVDIGGGARRSALQRANPPSSITLALSIATPRRAPRRQPRRPCLSDGVVSHWTTSLVAWFCRIVLRNQASQQSVITAGPPACVARGFPDRAMLRFCNALLALAVLAGVAQCGPNLLPWYAPMRCAARARSRSTAGLDEAAWAAAPKHKPASSSASPRMRRRRRSTTRFAILYDDEAGVRRRVGRRPAARVDPRAVDPARRRRARRLGDGRVRQLPRPPHRVRVSSLNAAGVQRDMLLFDDTNSDDTWDAVWTGDVALTPTGGPPSTRHSAQPLRFASDETQEWGLQILAAVSAAPASRTPGRRGHAARRRW